MVKSNKPKMARYSMSSRLTGSHTPVHWDTEEFNLGIIYNNGVITIDEPGYYRVTAACYLDTKDRFVGIETFVNGVQFIKTWSTWASPGFSAGIKHLDMFDTIFFKKHASDEMSQGKGMNYFMIEKI